jgi:hypothetical protein
MHLKLGQVFYNSLEEQKKRGIKEIATSMRIQIGSTTMENIRALG